MSISDYTIIDTTLREGEQFSTSFFTLEDKVQIARALSDFGIDHIELTSPAASLQSRHDGVHLSRLGLNAKLLAHIRCSLNDAKIAVETGLDGINIVIGLSPLLCKFGHGKTIPEVIDLGCTVLTYIHEQSPNIELRFSAEDAFRTPIKDLMEVYKALIRLGFVNRLGISDTVGIASPDQAYDLVRMLRQETGTDIEFHGHNDTGCAIANSYAALRAGATHISTSVLGIGERNGITPLEGLIAKMYTIDRAGVMAKYRLEKLYDIDRLVADKVGISVPFNHCITGSCAFTHKAGIHTKAVLSHPGSYEPLQPDDFGLQRRVLLAHNLVGWHSVQNRATQLGLEFSEAQLRSIAQGIKSLSKEKKLTSKDIDNMLLRKKAELETETSQL